MEIIAGTALNLKESPSTEINTVTLCLGTLDSFFGGFLSPLLESLAPTMPSPTPATPSVFPARVALYVLNQ